MKKLLLATAMLFIFTSELSAYTLLGEGNQSCGQYVLDTEKASAPFDENDVFSFLPSQTNGAWVQGFISGYNMATSKDVGKGIDTPAIDLWLLNYCKANPLKYIDEAATALITELDK